MASYGRMYDRSRRGMRGYGYEFNRRGYGYGRSFRPGLGETGYGGLRSDASTPWERFEGEGGWLGEASPGYPGGEWSEAAAVNRGFQRARRPGGPWRREFDRYGYGHEFGPRRRAPHDHLARVRVADIMTDDPEAVTPDTSIEEVARRMRELDVGIIPVVDSPDNRRLRGVVTDRDLAIRALAEGLGGETSVAECMSGDVRAVNKNDSVREVLDVMRDERVRRVPVTDREGRLVGIVAQADLAVDFAADPRDEIQIEETIERISEPARPRR